MRTRTTTAPAEALGIVTICFGWPILVSISSMLSGFNSREFTDNGFLGLIVMEAVLSAVAITVLRVRGYAFQSLYPRPSWLGIGFGVALYGISLVISWVAVSPFLADYRSQPVYSMVENASVSLAVIVPMAIINGAYEEVFLLGFLARGLSAYGMSTAAGVSLLVRVLYHLYQGPVGAVSVLAIGSTFTVFYLRTGGLFPAVFAHVLWDIIPFI